MDLFVLIFFTLISFCSTGIVDIDFLMKPETVRNLPAVGMFTTRDSPLPQLFADAPSFLTLNLTFNIGRAPDTGNYDPIMEIVVVHSSLLPKIGVNIAPTVDTVLKPGTGYCCDETLNQKLLCKDEELGKLIIGIDKNKASHHFYYFGIYENNISTHLNKFDFRSTISFHETGVWYVIMANCNPVTQTEGKRGSETVATLGSLEWKNPYGYLPGQVVAYLPIYWSLAAFLFLYSLLWSLLSCIYRKGLMVLQLLIGVVIIACLTDAVVSGAGYLTYNLEGKIYLYTVGLAAFLGSVKSTGIRVLFLCVGMGLSITRVKLTIPEYLFTTIIALCFFAFDLAYEFQKLTTTSGEPVWNILTWVANIGLFFANIIFLAWIVFSTYTTMFELKQEGQTFKFSQYKTLVILILICLCLSLILAIFQVVVEALHVQDEWFRWWWIWEMFWQIVSLAGLIAISMLWRPSTNNNQYAYSMQIPTEDPSGNDKDIGLDDGADSNIGLDELDPPVNTEVGNKTANISSDEDSLTSSSL